MRDAFYRTRTHVGNITVYVGMSKSPRSSNHLPMSKRDWEGKVQQRHHYGAVVASLFIRTLICLSGIVAIVTIINITPIFTLFWLGFGIWIIVVMCCVSSSA